MCGCPWRGRHVRHQMACSDSVRGSTCCCKWTPSITNVHGGLGALWSKTPVAWGETHTRHTHMKAIKGTSSKQSSSVSLVKKDSLPGNSHDAIDFHLGATQAMLHVIPAVHHSLGDVPLAHVEDPVAVRPHAQALPPLQQHVKHRRQVSRQALALEPEGARLAPFALPVEGAWV